MVRTTGHWHWIGYFSLALALASAPAVAEAQSFSFGISTGHGHHHHHGWHHHHDCWPGSCCGPYWGPSFGVVYAPPPPVVRERVVYVEPRVTAAPPVVTPPLATRQATPTTNVNALPVDTSVTDDRIVIRNTSGANLAVAFLVDGQDVELADGSTRTFIGKARRTVTYDRGGRFGSTQQDLAAGHYEFRVTASGWDLVRKPDVPAASRTAVRTNSLPESDAVR